MEWVLSQIRKHSKVIGAEKIDDQLIKINSTKHKEFLVGFIKTDCVTLSTIKSFICRGVQFVLNLPKDDMWNGDAIQALDLGGIAFGGLSDLYRVLNSSNKISSYRNPELKFIEENLPQHDKVSNIIIVFDKVIKIERFNLPTLTIAFIGDYELTADSVRLARKKYGKEFSIILSNNPNGTPTSKAYEVAESIGIEIYKWGELLGRLNKK